MTFFPRHSLSLCAGIVLFLAGCGGPTYTTHVVNTPETRQLQGHQRPYEINGQRYQPLRSHQGFTEEGVASWYGKDFHGKKTSNGEIYNMYAMTAAHKTLPLGVFVRVTNRSNNKQVIVRVNDRGPFVKSRIIDLSFAAASALDVVGSGTSPVRIEALGYRDREEGGEPSYHEPSNYAVSSYAVQIGSFAVEENARRLAARMSSEYGVTDVREGMIDGKRFYRVHVGPYPTMDTASAAELRFAQQGFVGCFVVALE